MQIVPHALYPLQTELAHGAALGNSKQLDCAPVACCDFDGWSASKSGALSGSARPSAPLLRCCPSAFFRASIAFVPCLPAALPAASAAVVARRRAMSAWNRRPARFSAAVNRATVLALGGRDALYKCPCCSTISFGSLQQSQVEVMYQVPSLQHNIFWTHAANTGPRPRIAPDLSACPAMQEASAHTTL